MKYIMIFLLIFSLVGCGSSESKQDNLADTSVLSIIDHNTTPTIKQDDNISTITDDTLTSTTDINSTSATKQDENTSISDTDEDSTKTITNTEVLSDRTLTIYIHGYSQDGEDRKGVFGENSYDSVINKMVKFTEFDTTFNYKKDSKNIIAIATYYGDTPPSYYTQKDKDDIEKIDNGIPRYALIMAKFARQMMSETNSSKLNIVSASMGSLVTRYLIEKDLESLASKKIIKKWLSLEGVIAGNIAASNKQLLDLVNTFEKQPYEVKQMKYSWVDKNLNPKNKYYKDIDIAFESSTKDDLNSHLITYITHEANDGVQAVKDTYFDNYSHTFFHVNHIELDSRDSAWGFASTFLISNKRVKITLLDASLFDLHEDKLFYGSILPAEVVFQSKIYSPTAISRWGFSGSIDERMMRGYYLPLYKYKKEDEPKELNQILFDGKVLDDEEELKLTITPYELDYEPIYGVKEFTGHGEHESLDTATLTLPLVNGVYNIQSNEWQGKVKVEVH